MKVVILLLIKFLLISALFIVSNENLALKDPLDREVFLNRYGNWINNVFKQTAELAGSVIDLKWLPEESFADG